MFAGYTTYVANREGLQTADGSKAPRLRRTPDSDAVVERDRLPYRMLGRELTFRVKYLRLDRASLAEPGPQSEALRAAMSGSRPLAENLLSRIAEKLVLKREFNETVELARRRLQSANHPNASRLLLVRGLSMPMVVNAVDTVPLIDTSRGDPIGLVPELMTLLSKTLEFRIQWGKVEFKTLSQQVDRTDLTVAVIDTLRREAHGTLVPLPLPFEFGINGVTASPEVPGNMSYQDAMEFLKEACNRSHNPIRVLVVKGELASEYASAYLHAGIPVIEETELDLPGTIDEYTRLPGSNTLANTIVFADHMSCSIAARRPGLRQLFAQKIGRFQPAFLLPAGDSHWAEFFRDALVRLMFSKLPAVALILHQYAGQTAPLLTKKRGGTTENPVLWSGHLGVEPIPIDDWYRSCWPDEAIVPWPPAWYSAFDPAGQPTRADERHRKEQP